MGSNGSLTRVNLAKGCSGLYELPHLLHYLVGIVQVSGDPEGLLYTGCLKDKGVRSQDGCWGEVPG